MAIRARYMRPIHQMCAKAASGAPLNPYSANSMQSYDRLALINNSLIPLPTRLEGFKGVKGVCIVVPANRGQPQDTARRGQCDA